MDNPLRTALERKGLPVTASEIQAQEFYAGLSLEEKGRLGVDLGLQAFHQSGEPLSIREDHQTRDITTRGFQLRAQTVNEEDRSVESVISTDAPVEVWDWRRGEVVDEILLAPAAKLPGQMPMLANHDRWSLDSVLGSIRNLRADGGQILGRLFFTRDDEDADKAWNKVRQGHIVDVSVGYRVNESVEIRPGQSAIVGGRSFTAGKRALRVVTDWTPKEGSLVPIGADQAAKIREDQTVQNHHRKEGSLVNPKLRAFLVSLGMRAESTDTEAQAFYDALPAADKTRADASANETATPASPAQSNRSESTPPPVNPAQPVDPSAVARQAVAAERERVRALRELAGQDVSSEMVTRAVDEGWDVDRASREFLAAVRTARSSQASTPYHQSAYTGPAPKAGSEGLRALAAGVIMTHGCEDVTKRSMHNGRRDPSDADRMTTQDAERGSRFVGMSMSDVIRHAAFMDAGRSFLTTAEALDAIRAAPSGGTLAYIWTTSMYAKLVEGWEKVTDTTSWCESEDVPNFLTQEDISLAANARLDRHGRGGTAKHATLSDSRETYKISRYSKKFVVDEMDQIDDRLGAIMRMPMEMGEAAAETVPDLVYSLLLENAAMADTGALFNNTGVATAGGHANLTTAVLGAVGLKAAILAMGKYREGDRVLNIKPRFLIIPSALQWTAKELLTSTAQAYTTAAAAATPSVYYPINVIAGENLTLVIDDRVGAAGCWDPEAATTRTGLDTNWFMSSARRTVRKLFRSGTGRRPQMRSFTLDQGQWGVGWDINFDAGAMVPDYRGLHKSAGTG